jgi:hypothetical protein
MRFSLQCSKLPEEPGHLESLLCHIKVANKPILNEAQGRCPRGNDAALRKGILEMTIKSTRSLLAAVLLSACATAAILAQPANAADTLSDAVARHLTDAQAAMQKKPADIPGAQAAIAAAKGVSSATDFDKYTIARVELAVDANANDMPAAAAAAIVAADSPKEPDKDKPGNYYAALQLTLVTKQNDLAMKYAKLLQATNPTDPAQLQMINNAYYFGQDFKDAEALAQQRIDAAKKAGKTPDRNALQLLLSSQAGLKDEAGAEATLEEEVADYNDPNDWAQLIDVAITSPGIRDLDAIWLGRLLFAVGGTVSKQDADMIGALASHDTFFGDAVNAKTHGGTVDPDPGPRADADKKTIQQQIAAEAAQPGVYSAKLAEALYSYGMYPEAEAAARLAMQKGGDPDASEAPMVLGQALIGEGKYSDAIAAFGQVTGGGPATPRIVRLWTDYAKFKAAPPAAPAAAAQAAAH